MATSNEKVRDLSTRIPELVDELLGDVSLSFMGIPLPVGEIVNMASPLVDGEVERLVAMPTDELDELLDTIGGFVAALRSDDA